MKIYLSSYFSDALATPYSVSRFQPEGFNLISLDMFKPYLMSGTSIKTKDPKMFLEAYCYTLSRNAHHIIKWVSSLEESVSLLCWCNEERNSRSDGKLLCHTILIGYCLEFIIKTLKLDIEIVYLDGRTNPVWSKEEFQNEIQRILEKK